MVGKAKGSRIKSSQSGVTRRELLRGSLGSAMLMSLGLTGYSRAMAQTLGADSCDPERPVDWIPNCLYPASYGSRLYGAGAFGNGPPSAVEVLFPSAERGLPSQNPILGHCQARWPVVLFLHGQMPSRVDCANELPDSARGNYYRMWHGFLKVLARCGYVVAIPRTSQSNPSDPEGEDIAEAWSIVEWLRSGWEHAGKVDANPDSTAVMGHSFGAVRASHVVAQHPTVAAYASLGGYWEQPDPDFIRILTATNVPGFFSWTAQSDDGYPEDLDRGEPPLWDSLTQPKYGLTYTGNHFDYIWEQASRQCDYIYDLRCRNFPIIAGELLALFLGRFLPVNLSAMTLPPSRDEVSRRALVSKGLAMPEIRRNSRQNSFAGNHLQALHLGSPTADCILNLRWQEGSFESARTIGS